jgi:hypothetical protein
MRGLEQIKEINENPHAARRDDAIFAGRHHDHDRETQRFHGERVEARQRERAAHASGKPKRTIFDDVVDSVIADIIGGKPKTAAQRTAEALADMVIFGALASGAERPYHPTHMDRIQPGIDQPPFVKFWAALNASREARGDPEALYKEARTLFSGGETPVGAMTFIGKQWDGLRAVPAQPVKFLGGERPQYHGEYRETSERGVIWHKVGGNEMPEVFKIPEQAITAAERVRNYRTRTADFKS